MRQSAEHGAPNGQSKGRVIVVNAVRRGPERRPMRYRVHSSSGCVSLSTAAAHSVSFEFLPTDARSRRLADQFYASPRLTRSDRAAIRAAGWSGVWCPAERES